MTVFLLLSSLWLDVFVFEHVNVKICKDKLISCSPTTGTGHENNESFLNYNLSPQQLRLCPLRLVSVNVISSASGEAPAPLNVWITRFPICHMHVPVGFGVSYKIWSCTQTADMLLSVQFTQWSWLFFFNLSNIMAAWTIPACTCTYAVDVHIYYLGAFFFTELKRSNTFKFEWFQSVHLKKKNNI